MKVHVLGSCAGGGLPQWNCGGANSVRARLGDPSLPWRSQASIAVSSDGRRWSLLNASPDLREQFARFPGLHPREGTRDVALDTVVLTNAELDHTLGLLILREALSYHVLSTPWVREALLVHNAAWRLLEPCWRTAKLDETVTLDREGDLEGCFFPVPAKVPNYLKERVAHDTEASVGVRLTDRRSGRRLVYAPCHRSLDPGTLEELAAADCRFADGTFFTADELHRLRPGAPDAAAMGHMPIAGDGGSLAELARLPGRTLYIHMNNTNPILDRCSPEATQVREAGVEIAADGLEFEV